MQYAVFNGGVEIERIHCTTAKSKETRLGQECLCITMCFVVMSVFLHDFTKTEIDYSPFTFTW